MPVRRMVHCTLTSSGRLNPYNENARRGRRKIDQLVNGLEMGSEDEDMSDQEDAFLDAMDDEELEF